MQPLVTLPIPAPGRSRRGSAGRGGPDGRWSRRARPSELHRGLRGGRLARSATCLPRI